MCKQAPSLSTEPAASCRLLLHASCRLLLHASAPVAEATIAIVTRYCRLLLPLATATVCALTPCRVAPFPLRAHMRSSVMLVGTKVDIAAEDRQVSTDEAQQFAESHGWLYFETSAKSGVHVRDAFYLLACTVMNKLLESDPKNLINDKLDIQGKGSAGKAGCC